MSWLLFIGCGLVGFGIAFSVIPVILHLAAKRAARTQDFHHTHQTSVPRYGGLALALAFIGTEIFISLVFPQARAEIPGRLVIISASLAMFVLGFMDDLNPLGAKVKLVSQVAIAGILYLSGVGIVSFKIPFTGEIIDLGMLGGLVTILWLVGMTNLINLIDGVDGLAGGISLMLMGLLVYLGHDNGGFELLITGVAGALLAFLWYNFPPARVYLGDGGAYLLGFQIGAFSIVSSQKGTIVVALVAPLFVLALPIVDTSLAILRRSLRGLPVFRPDQRHLHHHLLRMGLSRRKVVLTMYAVTLVFLFLGLAAYWSRGQLVPILLGAGALILLLCAGNFSFSREWFAIGRTLGNSLAMREEIKYALCLTRWLEFEGDRCASVDDLFSSLGFAGERLGFSYLKLTLKDRERTWRPPEARTEDMRIARFDLQGGQFGTLEVGAPSCQGKDRARCKREGGICACPCIADARLFEIVSELLGEGWMKACQRFQTAEGPLESVRSIPQGRKRRLRGQRKAFTAESAYSSSSAPMGKPVES